MPKTALIILLSSMLLLNACASLLVGRPTGASQSVASSSASDSRMTNQINAALVREPGISSLDVYVSTSRGVVTLRGTVSNQQMKNRATEIAYSVSGVRSVSNQLRLR